MINFIVGLMFGAACVALVFGLIILVFVYQMWKEHDKKRKDNLPKKNEGVGFMGED